MSTALTVSQASNLPATLGPDLTAAMGYAKAEKAHATRKAYGTDFRLFKAYCDAKGVSSLPATPETVAAYLAAEAKTAKPSTIGRHIAAIRYRTSWRSSSRYQPTQKALRRPSAGSAGRSAAPETRRRRQWRPRCKAWLRWRRKASQGYGTRFALARVRWRVSPSELVALDVADIEETETRLLAPSAEVKRIKRARSSDGQSLRGRGLPGEGVRAWLDAAGISPARCSARSIRRAPWQPHGSLVDRSPISSRLTRSAPDLMARCFRAIRCGPAS